MDALTISILTFAVAVTALLLGPGVGVRSIAFLRKRWQARNRHKREIWEYLRHSALFLEGLPQFIRSTWSWGPSVPNYGAGGSFPPDTPYVRSALPEVCAITDAVVTFYTAHSRSHGLPRPTLDGALGELRTLEAAFWSGVTAFAKRRWPLTCGMRIRQLRNLQIPQAEHDRIRQLKATRDARNAS